MQDIVKMMYILAETEDTSGISLPLKTTNRIKFLSFSASDKFIVFGATSGGLYVYDRESFIFKSLVPSKEGPITCVKISPDDKWFGFSTARGISCVLEHCGSSVNRRILSHVHEGRTVTALQWNDGGSQLYVGDNTGQISVISVASYLTPAVALMQLDSTIIQIDTCSYMLLVSTQTRSYLCDTLREQYRQIGSRLRDGEFGACFYQVDNFGPPSELHTDVNSDQKDSHGPFSSLGDGEWLLADKHLQNTKLFCARPGLRLWEVRIDGAVMNTHQFKQLRSTPPVKVVQPPSVSFSTEASELHQGTHLLQFSKLCKVSNKYIFTSDSTGFCVLDPVTSEVILWTNQFKNIVDVHIVGDIMYLWMGDCKLHAISLIEIDKFLVRMYLQKKYLYCAEFCAAHVETLKKMVIASSKMHILVDLLQKVEGKENFLDEATLGRIQELLEEVAKNVQNHEQAQMLNSGIFIVGNAHLLSQKEESRSRKIPYLGSEKLNDLMQDIFSNMPQRQELQPQENFVAAKIYPNGTYKTNMSPSTSLSSLLAEQSNANDEEDYDPFPDMPLSSLTSTETIMALKNLTTTVSGTISNSTKSLKEKWQNLEEKLRGQEESGLSVEKSINRHDVQTPNTHENNNEERRSMVIALSKLPISTFMIKSHRVANHQANEGEKSAQELEFEMLDSFALLYENYRQSLVPSQKSASSTSADQESTCYFQKWLNSRNIVTFPFHSHFDKNFLATLSKIFHNCLKSGCLIKWVSQFLPHLSLDHSIFPSHIGRVHSKQSLLLDQALGRTLGIWSELLDPHSALQCLDESSCSCQYFSWNVIMDHFLKSTSATAALAPVEENSHAWPLPRTLNAMLVMLQLGRVESCRNIGAHISIKHVLRTVLRLNEDPIQMCNLFLSYLEKVTVAELLATLADPEVYYFTRHAFENLHKSDPNSLCACGYPLSQIKYQRTFGHVGQALLSHIFQTEGLSETMSLCQRTGVLWLQLLILRRDEAVEEVLPLILHISSEDELKYRSSEMTPPTWDMLFQLKVKLEQGHCLHCGASLHRKSTPSSIPWMTLVSLLLHETSVEFTLSLVSKFSQSIPAGSLDLQFYQNCLFASVAECQSTKLKKNLLTSLTDKKSLPVMSPELAEQLRLPHCQGRHHWGLRLQLSASDCICCLLPLASSSGGSVVSFICRHSFHSVCLQRRHLNHCPICVKS